MYKEVVDTLTRAAAEALKSESAKEAAASTAKVVHEASSSMASHSLDTLSDAAQSAAITAQTAADTLHPVAAAINFNPQLPDSSTAIDSSWQLHHIYDSVGNLQPYADRLFVHGKPLPYTLDTDVWVTGSLLLAFLLLTLLLAWHRRFLSKQLHEFFLPTNNAQQDTAIKTASEVWTPYLLAATQCLFCGVLLFALAGHFYDFGKGVYPAPLIFGVCVGAFAAYHLLRFLLYSFINWIFFKKTARRQWKSGFSLLISLESLLMLPIVVCGMNLDWHLEKTLLVVVIVYGLLRILLLYHSYRIFFPKFYGVLHLFAYLCTLELLPVLALWATLKVLCEALIVK